MAVKIASLSMIMEPITDCSASRLFGIIRLISVSSIKMLLLFLYYMDTQLTGHFCVKLNRHFHYAKASDRLRELHLLLV